MAKATLFWQCACNATNSGALDACGTCGLARNQTPEKPPKKGRKKADKPRFANVQLPPIQVVIAPEISRRSWVLPLPPSANTYWRRAGHHIYISEKGKAFKNIVHNLLSYEHITPYGGQVAVLATFYYSDERRDIDNFFKPLLDALKGVVFEDDNQVAFISGTRRWVAPSKTSCTVSVYFLEEKS